MLQISMKCTYNRQGDDFKIQYIIKVKTATV